MKEDYFSYSYFEAREKFKHIAEKQGGELFSYPHPISSLFVDVAYFGKKEPQKLLIVVSGVHGGEGFFGSAVQSAFLGECLKKRGEVALLFVHAINPYGFANIQRETEDNIDLNRNFLDHSQKKYPRNDGYNVFAEALIPKKWESEERQKSDAFLRAYEDNEREFFDKAIFSGQYLDPKGFCFGGNEPCWSNQTFRAILKEFAVNVPQVALIDLHTGLGTIGKVEIFSSAVGEKHEKVESLYGDIVPVISLPYPLQGDLVGWGARKMLNSRFVGCVMEFGTVISGNSALDFLRADQCLRNYGNTNSDLAQKIKKELKEALCPSDKKWRQFAINCAIKVIKRAQETLNA